MSGSSSKSFSWRLLTTTLVIFEAGMLSFCVCVLFIPMLVFVHLELVGGWFLKKKKKHLMSPFFSQWQHVPCSGVDYVWSVIFCCQTGIQCCGLLWEFANIFSNSNYPKVTINTSLEDPQVHHYLGQSWLWLALTWLLIQYPSIHVVGCHTP